MILVPFFATSSAYGSTKNLLSLPFQAPVFFVQTYIEFCLTLYLIVTMLIEALLKKCIMKKIYLFDGNLYHNLACQSVCLFNFLTPFQCADLSAKGIHVLLMTRGSL